MSTQIIFSHFFQIFLYFSFESVFCSNKHSFESLFIYLFSNDGIELHRITSKSIFAPVAKREINKKGGRHIFHIFRRIYFFG